MSSQDFINALGTLANQFRIGLNGPMFVAVGAEKFRLVNIENTQYLRLETNNPIDPQDVVTLAYLTSLFALLVSKGTTISTIEGIQGGGDLSTNRTFKLDINGLVEVATVDPLVDFIVIYDFSAGFHRKIKPSAFVASTIAAYPIYFGASSVTGSTTTRYLYPCFDSSIAQTIEIGVRVTRNGTLQNLFIVQNNPAGNGNSIVYTVRINGVDTLLVVTIASNVQNGSNIVDTVIVLAGDRVSIKVTKSLTIGVSPDDILATLELT